MNRIQQIFSEHAQAYLERFGDRIPQAHQKVIDAICECRQGQRGYHIFECPDCGKRHVANSSCGNRHCPVCQHRKATEWVYQRQLQLLPYTYFMATFTLPEELRAVARSNQAAVYKAMFNEASASLSTLEADKRFIGCNVAGFFGVLHTWGRPLQYHPHIHFVVPGGGLSENRDQWVSAKGKFLVHVRASLKCFVPGCRRLSRLKGLTNWYLNPFGHVTGSCIAKRSAMGRRANTLHLLVGASFLLSHRRESGSNVFQEGLALLENADPRC